MTRGKKNYAELLAERNKLQARVERLERAMKEADRSIHLYHVSDWIAVPLPHAQEVAVREAIENGRGLPAREGKLLSSENGEERWEQIWEDDYQTLPGKRYYLVRYTYTQDEGITDIRPWALVPF
jgi:hypothetical protein